MFDYFKKRIFAKIGLLFLFASFVLLVSAYYVFNLSFTESDNILDAHDAYHHYKLVDSWGLPPDSTLLKDELENLKLGCAIFYMDEDTLCENDSLIYWSNFENKVDLCDYISFSDSQDLGERHGIDFPSYVSFGDLYYFNRDLSAVLVHNGGFQYLLTIGFIEPNIGFNVVPLIVLIFVFMFFLYWLVTRLLNPINWIEKRITALGLGDFSSKIKVVGEDELAMLSNNLNHLVAQLKTLLDQKERLLSDVSHELRTPLAKIRLLLALVPQHTKIKEVDKHIKTIDSLITNILLSDKMSTPYSNLNKKKIDIKSLVNEALDMSFVKTVEFNFNSYDTMLVYVDIIKMSVAIKNLLENALKYSGQTKEIYLNVSVDEKYLYIAVVDNGPGVDLKIIDKITKAFVRGKNNPGTGFGLGLSICKKVIEAHGGYLKIKNNSSGGASFTLCLLK